MALVAISPEPLSVQACLDAVADSSAGGVGLFVGVVRDSDDGRGVTALSYTAHPSAVQILADVCAEAAAREGITAVSALHRVGDLVVGDLAVVVAVSGPHRGDALEATRWLIDTVKERVPIWKEQTFRDGGTEWVGSP